VTSPTLENRYSFLTGSGKAAIGVAWFRGPAADELLKRCFRASKKSDLSVSPVGSVVYGRWGFSGAGSPVEEDVVVLKRGPSEYEVHVHGGEQSRACLRRTFESGGFDELESEQWLRRQVGSELAAAVAFGLLHCQTERAARLLLGQETAWRRLLHKMHTLVSQRDALRLVESAEEVLGRKSLAEHLTKPWRVVLAGLPNVGKSSLINAICGFERAIVHSAPGTTRDVVTQQVVIDGWLFEVADTAGQRDAEGEIERAGIELARVAWHSADCRVEVRDASKRAEAAQFVIEPAADLIVANKVDLSGAEVEANELPVSARTGVGLSQLQSALVQRVLPHAVGPLEPLPVAGPLMELLEEMRGAGQTVDWLAVERIYERLAEYCGRRKG
jgi:tRNA modification GTPase